VGFISSLPQLAWDSKGFVGVQVFFCMNGTIVIPEKFRQAGNNDFIQIRRKQYTSVSVMT
jgi:hypothetical protein